MHGPVSGRARPSLSTLQAAKRITRWHLFETNL